MFLFWWYNLIMKTTNQTKGNIMNAKTFEDMKNDFCREYPNTASVEYIMNSINQAASRRFSEIIASQGSQEIK